MPFAPSGKSPATNSSTTRAESRRENMSRAFGCLKIESGFRPHSAAELADQRRPAVELRQDRIGLGGSQADDHAGDAVVAVALEQLEVLFGAPDRDRHRRRVAAR